MRLFVAVFPPPEVREALSDAARGLRIEGEARRTRPENIHLTLKFLGETPDESLEPVSGALEIVAGRHAPLELAPSGFGGFPSARKARVIWAGLEGDVDRLRRLAAEVEDALHPLGFERERRVFSPHLTLGRAKGRPVSLEVEREMKAPGFEAREMRLVKSEPGQGGAVYTPLGVYPLAGSG